MQRFNSLLLRAVVEHRVRQAATFILYAGLAFGAAQPSFATGADPSAPGGTLVHPRYGHTSTLMANGSVLVAGGGGHRPTPPSTVTGASGTHNPGHQDYRDRQSQPGSLLS